MSNLVIVAIPDENDPVWKISSEKVPHLTLLFLGEAAQNVAQIVQFVQHAADTMLNRFYLAVDRRGELGADQADVLFFKTNRYEVKAIQRFRSALLQDNNIRTAYDSATQFDGPWQPHLTLGYPATPAKPDERDYGVYDVSFNKIAVWIDDFDGPDFLLKDYWDDIEMGTETVAQMSVPEGSMEDSMNQTEEFLRKQFDGKVVAKENQKVEVGAEFLSHYGRKGMRWGVRTRGVRKLSGGRPAPTPVAPTATSKVPKGSRRKTKIKAEGGENHPAHDDAIKVARAQIKLKKSGPAALSNHELQDLQTRMNLERNVTQLVRDSTRAGQGQKFVRDLTGMNKQFNETVNTGYQTTRLAKQVRGK